MTRAFNYNELFRIPILYIITTIIRFIVIFICYPIMYLFDRKILKKNKISWKIATVASWSGLRGAVGLCLAIYIDEQKNIICEHTRQKIFL